MGLQIETESAFRFFEYDLKNENLYDLVLYDLSKISTEFGYRVKVEEFKRNNNPHYQVDLRRGISHAEFAIQTLRIIEDEDCREKILKEMENEEDTKSLVVAVLADEIRRRSTNSYQDKFSNRVLNSNTLLTPSILESIKKEEVKSALKNGKELLDPSQLKSRIGHTNAFADGYDLVQHLVSRNSNKLQFEEQLIFNSNT